MSEDIDFKMQFKNTNKIFSKSRILKELKQFRTLVLSKLNIPYLTSDPPVIRNEGKYFKINMHYPSSFGSNQNLRPDILLEFTLSDIRLSVENLSIKTLIEDTFTNITTQLPVPTNCISVVETAVEKWVALTRKIKAIERTYIPDDISLIRHVYDLNAILKANKINDDFFSLAKVIVNEDAQQFKNQHPEYFEDPNTEIRKSLELLKHNKIWKERYIKFMDAMVYDKNKVTDFEAAIQSLEDISESIIKNLD